MLTGCPAVLCFLLFLFSTINAQNINIKFKQRLILGNDESAAEEYLFQYPSYLRTDSKRNIYIVEALQQKIRVFNRDGKFIKYIGKNGQGPGEMLNVSAIAIDHNDDLIVVDGMNRRFTRFTELGDKNETFPLPVNRFAGTREIIPIDEQNLLLYYVYKAPENEGRVQANEKIFHLFSPSDFTYKKSFCNVDPIWDVSRPFVYTLPGSRDRLDINFRSNKLFFSSKFYEGTLFLAEWINNELKIKPIKSGKKYGEAFKLLDFSDYPNRNYPSHYLIASHYEKFLLHIRTRSKGLAVFKNGIIAHFVLTYQSKEHYELGVEFFDKDCNFIEYQKIEEQIIDLLADKFIHHIMWQDPGTVIYALSVLNGFNVIRVLEVEFSK